MEAEISSRAVFASNAGVLRAIRDKDTSIAVWERDAPCGIERIQWSAVRDFQFTTPLADLAAALDRALTEGDYPALIRHQLAPDIAMLATRFAAILDLAEIEIRLERVTTNACRKFHADYVTARLLCTYVGQGTQWLDADESSRECGDVRSVRQMSAGDVAILKGRLWSENTPAIHRSPPIEGTGEERLVLAINPPLPKLSPSN